MFNLGPKKSAPKKTGKSAPKATAEADPSPKDPLNAKRDREAARSRAKSAQSREIGPLPPIANPARRESCRPSLRLFLLTYLKPWYPLPFSKAHLKAIEKLERAILQGGLFALAMPRGRGKTTLVVGAAIWALVYGLRRYLCLIAANEKFARKLLKNIKEGLTDPRLAGDFPEICYPLVCIENDARRCVGQILNGIKTTVAWQKDTLVLPTVEGSIASGSIVTAVGLTGAVRGQNHLSSGEILRPDLVILDDPQTRKSAWSDGQCETRIGIVNADVLGLAGPGRKIAAVMPCTVIRRGDLADHFLDRNLCPDWQGERTRMLDSLPANEKLWEEYGQIRQDSLRADGDGHEATDFYREHQAKMDAGGLATWPERYDADEISAIQHAMNLKLRDEDAFAAEYQNEPHETKPDVTQLKAEELATRLSGFARGLAPRKAEKLTAFIDVQDNLLYYGVCAWAMEDFDGWIIDYGTFPEQQRRYFTLRQASPTLASKFPGLPKEAFIRRGLETFIAELFARQYKREDGAPMPIDKLLIDQGYVKPVVHNFIRSAGRGNTIMPAKGVGIGAAAKPMSEYRRKPGEQLGTNWMIPAPEGAELRHVRHDTNFWKSLVHQRFALPNETKGTLRLYGNKSGEHRLIADHLAAEFGTPTEGHGRQLVEFRPRPGAGDNHLLDVIVGCAVAASMVGCGTAMAPPRRPKRRASYREPVYLT